MENTISFDLQVYDCPTCGRKMMNKDKADLFPCFYKQNQKTQMEKKGVVFISDARINNDHICEVCKKEDKGSFECYLCKKVKTSSKLKKSVGYGMQDFLCLDCYRNVSAKKWDDAITELEERHKYDAL